MPGIVVFKRRWSVGSDDFAVPGIFLLILHTVWLIVLTVILSIVDFGQWSQCILDLHEHVIGYIVILTGCIIVEGFISWVSMRGTILYTAPRASMQYLLYVRLGILLVELAWLIVGVVWISRHYNTCPLGVAKKAVLGIIVCNWCVLLSVMVTVWCTFDAAGRTWVKMKRYQRSLREGKAKFRYRRSGNSHRNWRHRKAVREYQDSWNKRCRLLFCCMGRSDRNRNSFAEIAKLLSEFFRDLDVVPSDVVAGLVLLRKFQRLERQATVKQRQNDIYQFLSGVAVSPSTKFLDITHPGVAQEVRNITHYLHYALAVYGWPMFMILNSGTGCCQLCPYLRCCCFKQPKSVRDRMLLVDDNCCRCNYAALQKLCKLHNMEIVFATYHVEVGETPFFVALDHEKRTVVVSIRGTLSLQDVITDLNAEGEPLPTEPNHEDWIGHKGMVQAAEYIRRKLTEESILTQAFGFSPDKGSQSYDLVLVGHSLGAGAAAILAILLRQEYPNLLCYAYSPPGGLLSLPVVEYTKSFITSVVLGKDVVPRIGLHQMETLRSDLINAIKRSVDPKWKIIFSGVLCCCPEDEEGMMEGSDSANFSDKSEIRDVSSHPSDSSIALTVHQPLYPPGRIIHIVRNHPTNKEHFMKKNEPVYQAILAENTSFDEVLISPVMVQDHMPDKVLEALEKLLINTGPVKPQRNLTEVERRQLLSHSADTLDSNTDRTPPHRLVLETSFTDLQPDALNQEALVQSGTPARLKPIPHFKSDPNGSVDQTPKSPMIIPTVTVEAGIRMTLLHDNFIGYAPIASPETLSDISSISSKGSFQKLSNGGTRLSWGGVPIMETIAQSPAILPKTTPSGNGAVPTEMIDAQHSEGGVVCLPHLLDPHGVGSKISLLSSHQMVAEVTLEPAPSLERTRQCDPSQLSLNLQSGVVKFEGDSNYASSSTERASDRTFTPREPKRVTFELNGSQDSEDMVREESADSVYNSGDSFVPTYPEYNSQQREYGNHEYIYSSNVYIQSPLPSPPPLEHSASEVYLGSLDSRNTNQRRELRKSREESDLGRLNDDDLVFETDCEDGDDDSPPAAPPRTIYRNLSFNDAFKSTGRHNDNLDRLPPTESNL